MKWLVTVRFVHGRQEERAALLPAEQAHVRELMQQGIIEALHVAADRSCVWVLAQGESQEEVLRAFATLPLYPYMALELAPLLALGGPQAQGAATQANAATAAP